MTHEELRDRAYCIATGNMLTEILNYEEFYCLDDEEIELLAWEAIEFWSARDLRELVVSVADDVIMSFRDQVS